jgi:hypothetical protein
MTDRADDVAGFDDINVAWQPLFLPYSAELREEFREKAWLIARHVARPVRIGWRSACYVLRNPHPAAVLRRFTENRPFCFARLPHGFWDSWLRLRQVTAALRVDRRCVAMSDREVGDLAARLLIRAYPHNGTFVDNFFAEIEADLRQIPPERNFWTAVSFKGIPTFDDTALGYQNRELDRRLEIFAAFFAPEQILFDALLWKRWAISGDIGKLAEVVKSHPLILVGPEKFADLGEKWGLSDFTHIRIPPENSQRLRREILAAAAAAVEARLAPAGKPRPVVLFQCGGSLAYWFIRRLWKRHPGVFYLDIGQALDVWYWTRAPWLRIYEDAIRAANPFAKSCQPGPAEERGTGFA